MKKNFFKKLSFVLALAMVIAAIAPAAGAFAATGLRLNATSKTLFLGENDKYNFNVLGASAGATQKWTSSNTSVATVNAKNGVVAAKAVGTTTITATVSNAKKTFTKKLTAKVTVGNSAKTIKVAAPAGADVAKLAVATDYAFSAAVTTFGGTTKTTNKLVWSVDGTGATVSSTGVFNATKAGEYTVTVSAVSGKTVKATDSVKVTVVASIKEVKQVDANTITVTFDSDMSATDLSKTTANVYQVVNGKNVSTSATRISTLTLDSTGKVATVDLYGNFSTETTYTFVYGDLSATVKTATAKLADVASVVFDDVTTTSANATSMLSSVKLLNSDGVVILTGADTTSDGAAVANYLTFAFEGDYSKGAVSGYNAYVYTVGYSAPVKVTFSAYVYDTAAAAYKTLTYTDTANVTRTSLGAAVGASAQFKLAINGTALADSTWTNGVTSIAAGDGLYYINMRYLASSSATSYTYDNTVSSFYYRSSNDSVLLVSGNTVNPVAAGTATIVAYDASTHAVVATFDVTVSARRTLTSITQITTSVSLSNSPSVADSATVLNKVLDATATGYANASVTVTTSSKPSGAADLNLSTANPSIIPSGTDKGLALFTVYGANATVGTYVLKVVVQDLTTYETKTVYVTVNVIDGTNNATVSYYRLVSDTTSVDLKGNYDKTATVGVYGYNTLGAKVSKLTVGTHYTLSVTNGSTTYTAADTARLVNDGIEVVTTSGSAVLAYGVGTWTATATLTSAGASATGRTVNTPIGTAAFTVTDSTTKTLAVDDYTIVASSGSALVFDVVKSAFSFTLNGVAIDEVGTGLAGANAAGIVGVTYASGSAASISATSSSTVTASSTASTSMYISSVTYRVWNAAGTTYIDYVYYPATTVVFSVN